MGLAERRAEKDFKDNHFTAFSEQLQEKLGFPVELDFDWEKFTNYSHGGNFPGNYSQGIQDGLFEPLYITFETLAQQPELHAKLKKNLSKIRMTVSGFNVEELTLNSGVLELDVDPFYQLQVPGHRAMLLLRELGNKLEFDGDKLSNYGKSVKVSGLGE